MRLQQTIRVLAETAEVPAAVRAEAAARRLALSQRPEYREGPVAVGRPVQRTVPVTQEAWNAARRLRRTRVATTGILLAAAVVFLVQLAVMIAAGAAPGSWAILIIAGLAAVGSLTTLGRLAEVSKSRNIVIARPARRTSLGARQAAPPQRQAAWTPVPMPKPLYLSKPEAPAAPAADPEFELRVAAIAAERALRDAGREVPSIAPAAAASGGGRFAAMGIVDDASRAAPDLDAVLARRRAAG